MKASNFFGANKHESTTELFNVGAIANNGIAPLLYTWQGQSIGLFVSDSAWHDLAEVSDQAGIINLLWFTSRILCYTNGDVFKIRLTIDDIVVADSQVTMDVADKGAVICGGITHDGTNFRPLACGHYPFKSNFKVEQQVLLSGANAIPNVTLSYITTT